MGTVWVAMGTVWVAQRRSGSHPRIAPECGIPCCPANRRSGLRPRFPMRPAVAWPGAYRTCWLHPLTRPQVSFAWPPLELLKRLMCVQPMPRLVPSHTWPSLLTPLKKVRRP